MDQVKVSLFKDGPDRVQIVIDGNNISDYLSIIADSIKDTILLKNADAKPIAFNKYENVPFFKGTEYEGKTPSELLSVLGDKGLGILKKYGVHASEQQKSEIEICIKNFLSDRFKSVDPEIFAGKLNEHQLQVFLITTANTFLQTQILMKYVNKVAMNPLIHSGKTAVPMKNEMLSYSVLTKQKNHLTKKETSFEVFFYDSVLSTISFSLFFLLLCLTLCCCHKSKYS